MIFIARHLRMQSAILLYGKSVRPSVRLSVCLSHSGVVSKRMRISSNSFHRLVEIWIILADNSKRNSFSLGVKHTGWRFAISDRNRRLSRKRFKRGPWLLWISNRKSQVAVDPCRFQWPRVSVKGATRGSNFGGCPFITFVQLSQNDRYLAQ